MKIEHIVARPIVVPLKVPFVTALRRVEAVESILVQVSTQEGLVGYGEAPPTVAITGESKQSILQAIRQYIAPALTGQSFAAVEQAMPLLHGALPKNTSAKAAVDMALYDIFAQQASLPLYRFLGGSSNTLHTDITISLGSPQEMAQSSLDALQQGFTILKIKVGGNDGQDLNRVRQVRQAVGKDITLRVDANQAWDAATSVQYILAMEEEGLCPELVEQPVPAHDIEGLAHVTRQVSTPILADESVFSPEDAELLLQRKAADLVNIKLMKTGGIYGALQICRLAQQYGVQCMMGCMLETKLAVSAAAHLAASQACITRADLDGPSLCKIDPYTGGPHFNGPRIELTEAPGIGIRQYNGAYGTE